MKISLGKRCLFTGIVLAAMLSSSCAVQLNVKMSDESRFQRRILSPIASNNEMWEFKHALGAGPYTLETFQENFWADRDPTRNTEYNEYRARFEARLSEKRQEFTIPGRDYPDDRIIAYLLYGAPSNEIVIKDTKRFDHVEWIYEPPAEYIRAGSSYSLLKHLSFSVVFRVGNDGEYTLCPLRRRPWSSSRSKKWRLDGIERRELGALIQDREQDFYTRAAAVWRLRMDKSPYSLRTLLTAVVGVESDIRAEIEDAVYPLSIRVVQDEDMATTVLHGVETNEPVETPVPVEYATTETLLSRTYDPGWLYPSETVESLERAAAEADSTLKSHGWLEPEEADALYVGPLDLARTLLDSDTPYAAHEYLHPYLLNELSNNPEAWHLDALALLESASAGGRQQSEDSIRKALRLDPGNLRYLLTLARILYRRTFTYYAEGLLDQMLDKAPTLASAYALKAIIRLEIYWQLGWRASEWGGTSLYERYLPLSAYRASATDMINRALILDPDDSFATWWIGSHYLLARQWSAAIPVLNFLIENGAHEAEAYLGRGMAFQHLGMLEQAMADYESGLALLPPGLRLLAEDPRWVMLPSEGGISFREAIAPHWSQVPVGIDTVQAAGDTVVHTEQEVFWKSRDPLFSTEINERILEQHRRFAYVTWNFAIPNLGLKGWETHRGRIYLRYGEPLEYQATEIALGWPEYTAGESLLIEEDEIDWEGVAELTRKLHKTHIWTYPGIRFQFDRGWITMNFTVLNQSQVLEDIERKPESTRVEGFRTINWMDFTWHVFRDEEGVVEWVPVANIPKLSWEIAEPDWTWGETSPITYLVLDEYWDVIQEFKHTFPVALYLTGEGGLWVGPTLKLPGQILSERAEHIAVELVFPDNKPAYTSRETLPALEGEGLHLSSLVLAREVMDIESAPLLSANTHIFRKGRVITPVLGNVYPPDEPLYVYVEAYGLERDEYGTTKYQLALSITALEEDRPAPNPLVEAIGRLLSRESREGTVTLLFEREGIDTQVEEYLRVVFPDEFNSGEYRIDIGVEDTVSGQTASRSLRLILSR